MKFVILHTCFTVKVITIDIEGQGFNSTPLNYEFVHKNAKDYLMFTNLIEFTNGEKSKSWAIIFIKLPASLAQHLNGWRLPALCAGV